MPEALLTPRQADQARTDFAIIESDLEAIYARPARLLTDKQLVKRALLVGFVAAMLGIVGIEAFWRYFPACGSKFREPRRSPVFDNACRSRVSVFFTGALRRLHTVRNQVSVRYSFENKVNSDDAGWLRVSVFFTSCFPQPPL